MRPSTKQLLSIDSLILTPAEQEALRTAREAVDGMAACDAMLARIDAMLALDDPRACYRCAGNPEGGCRDCGVRS